ncbi:MAG: SDR family oxidoreductase, partial [Polyangiales bacterium]
MSEEKRHRRGNGRGAASGPLDIDRGAASGPLDIDRGAASGPLDIDRGAASGPLCVLDAMQGRHVLVTGVTGFLGKVWLGMLLERVPTLGRITVVIRSRRGETARERFEKIAATSPALRPLRAVHGGRILMWLRERVHVVKGDCSKPLCGLGEERAREVCADVDAVVHFAGVTDFMPDPKDALSSNVRGAVHAADLAALSAGRRLIHVSTTFVAGRVRGEVAETLTPGVSPNGTRFDAERELEDLVRVTDEIDDKPRRTDIVRERAESLGWPNLYTYSKGLAEHLLASRDDVRVTMVRPAIVECARSYPFEGWNQGINTSGPLVWLFSTSFRHFPSRPDHHFDVVPVDTVARGVMLVAAAALRDEARDVYQLGSSDTNPLTFGRAIDLTNLAVRRMHSRPDA